MWTDRKEWYVCESTLLSIRGGYVGEGKIAHDKYPDIPLVNNSAAVSMHVYIVTPAKRVQWKVYKLQNGLCDLLCDILTNWQMFWIL